MKKRVMIIAAVAAVVGVIGLFLLTRPRVLGNMSSRCSEPTTETSDISFSGEAGDRIKFSLESDIVDGDLDVVLYDSAGNEAYVLDRAGKLETFFTLERAGTYTLAAACSQFVGTYTISVYMVDSAAPPHPGRS